MSAKRRLSNGSKEYNLPVHETEDDEVGEDLIVSPKAGLSFGGGRRQSFGRRLSGGRRISGNTFEDNADQEKIAEMYKTIIKLSSENVINLLLSLIIIKLTLQSENQCQEFLELRSN